MLSGFVISVLYFVIFGAKLILSSTEWPYIALSAAIIAFGIPITSEINEVLTFKLKYKLHKQKRITNGSM